MPCAAVKGCVLPVAVGASRCRYHEAVLTRTVKKAEPEPEIDWSDERPVQLPIIRTPEQLMKLFTEREFLNGSK